MENYHQAIKNAMIVWAERYLLWSSFFVVALEFCVCCPFSLWLLLLNDTKHHKIGQFSCFFSSRLSSFNLILLELLITWNVNYSEVLVMSVVNWTTVDWNSYWNTDLVTFLFVTVVAREREAYVLNGEFPSGIPQLCRNLAFAKCYRIYSQLLFSVLRCFILIMQKEKLLLVGSLPIWLFAAVQNSLAGHLGKLELEHELEPFPVVRYFYLKNDMSFINSLIKM